MAFLAGATTLIAVAAPHLPRVAGLAAFDRFIAEFPELSASVAGVILMVLANGLRRRIDTAWAATCALLGALALYAALRHAHFIAGLGAGAAALALLWVRPAFFRRSRLSALTPGPRVAVGVAAALGAAAVGGLLWAGGRPGFREAAWQALFLDPHLGEPGRVVAAGALAFGVISLAGLLTERARGRPARPAPDDLARVRALMRSAEAARPDMHLALSGDKSFIFVEGAFMMAARSGGSLIAMGGPVGARARWREALIALRREADDLALRPVVYAAAPETLPDLLDVGFRVDKIGENAIVDLAAFSLSGKSKQDLRTARRKMAEREHAAFEVRPPPHDARLMEQLRPTSDAWLAAHGGQEKQFSLGRFDPDYLADHPLAIVRVQGKVLAFCNIWTTPDRGHAAIDLMRYDPAASPSGLMDFTFTECLLWAQREGFRDFDLGMAPLAGLPDTEDAPLFAKLGRLVYEHGEPFYGFQGLRKYKDKFAPRWEPRYLAAPGVWSMPVVLAEVGLITNGPPALRVRLGKSSAPT